jgi:hypothetical protein
LTVSTASGFSAALIMCLVIRERWPTGSCRMPKLPVRDTVSVFKNDHLLSAKWTESIAEMFATAARLNTTHVTTAAECVALVRTMFPDANAAAFSNMGKGWCEAIFNAQGVVYEHTVQTCIFA